jgi:glycosyltransferase domain-containing protein
MQMNTLEVDLSELTIVMPTFERPFFLLRQIKYLATWKTRIIIVDGSEKSPTPAVLEMLKSLPHIEYRHIRGSYVERISGVANEISTPFAMCLADDDLYLQMGLLQAIQKLKSNPSAVACMGQSIGLDFRLKKSYFFKYGSNLKEYSVNGKTPKQRILNGFTEYRSATPYAVFRTSIFKKVWRPREHLSSLETVEYEHAIRTYFYGKLISTDSIYWIRSFEAQPVPSIIDGSRATDFYTWLNGVKFESERTAFESRLVLLLQNSENTTEIESVGIYKDIIDKIVGKSHSSLSETNIKRRIFIKLASNLVKVPPLDFLKNTKFWKEILSPVLDYALRDKKLNLAPNLVEANSEMKEVLEFCDTFYLIN